MTQFRNDKRAEICECKLNSYNSLKKSIPDIPFPPVVTHRVIDWGLFYFLLLAAENVTISLVPWFLWVFLKVPRRPKESRQVVLLPDRPHAALFWALSSSSFSLLSAGILMFSYTQAALERSPVNSHLFHFSSNVLIRGWSVISLHVLNKVALVIFDSAHWEFLLTHSNCPCSGLHHSVLFLYNICLCLTSN